MTVHRYGVVEVTGSLSVVCFAGRRHGTGAVLEHHAPQVPPAAACLVALAGPHPSFGALQSLVYQQCTLPSVLMSAWDLANGTTLA